MAERPSATSTERLVAFLSSQANSGSLNADHRAHMEAMVLVDMRSVAMMFASLIIGVTAIATMAGCTSTTAQAQVYPAGVPWVPDDYANGKWVPGHYQGQSAQ